MARIPTYEEQPQSPMVSFAAPVPERRPLNYSRVQQAIGQWQNRVARQDEALAMKRQSEKGMVSQAELGPGGIAQPDPDIAFRFQQAFREGAEQLRKNQLEVDIQRTRTNLVMEHRFDPDGFRQAWSKYAESTEQSLKQTDPALAVQTREFILRAGEGTAAQLEENAFAREHAAQSAKLLRSVDEFANIADDELRNRPDEQRFYESIQNVEALVDNLVASNRLDPATAERVKYQKREQVIRAYVEGEFMDALRRRDADGAREVVESLYRGAWFEDNEQGRVTADRLARKLEQVFAVSGVSNSQIVSLGLNRLDRIAKAAEDGLPVDPEAAAGLLREIQAHNPTALQWEQAVLKHNGILFASQIAPDVEAAGLNDLLTYKQVLDDKAMVLEPELRRAVSGKVAKEIERIDGAYRENDLAAIGGVLNIYDSSPEIVSRRRELAANRIGAPVNRVPLWSNAELRQFNQDYARAVEAGDYDTMDRLTTMYMAPVLGDSVAMAAAAKRLADAGGPMAVAAQLALAGEALNVRDLQHQYTIGKNIDKSLLAKDTGIDRVDLVDDSIVNEAIRTISMGDQGLQQEIYDFFYNVYAAEVQRNREQKEMWSGKARRKARENIQRQLHPFTKSVKFDNGSVLPEGLVPTETVRDEINERLNNPKKYFGLVPGIDTEFIQPVPLDDGGIGFYHESMGRFLVDPGKNEPARVAVAPEEEKPGFFGVTNKNIKESLEKASKWAVQTAENIRSRSLDSYTLGGLADGAKIYGMDEKFFTALMNGIKRTPDEDKGTSRIDPSREAVRAEAQKEVRWDKVREKFRSQSRLKGVVRADTEWNISNPLIRPYAVADLFDQYKSKFKGDEKAMLAAYWEGPDLVSSLQKQYGGKWYDQLPMKTKQFIQRVQSGRH